MCVPLLHYVQFSKNFQQFCKSVKFFVHFVTKMYLELAPKADNRVLNVGSSRIYQLSTPKAWNIYFQKCQ